MNRSNQSNPSRETRSLHAVLADYIRRRDAGESVDIESLCQAYPEFADGLRSYAEGEGLIEDLADPKAGNDPYAETIRPGAGQRTDFAPSADFGRYRLVRELGNGAMGAVYLAEDTQLGRHVALKIPTSTGTEGPEFLKRFKREAQAAAKLEHPNLCRIYDFGDVNGTPYITMEYLDGPPLSQCVGIAGFRDERCIAEIVLGIASGLQCAHERGILHRDVKTSNVLIKNDEMPCVTDFGLAQVDEIQESKLTREGVILGTPAYMPPEQIRSEHELIGPRSDVYALGVVLYELLAGHTPFQGSTLQVLNQAMNDAPPPLQEVRPDVDGVLADYCLQMLEKDPERRPQSMQAVVEFLAGWLQQTSQEGQAQQAKENREREKYEVMKSKVLSLIQRGQHAKAIALLEKMQKLPSTNAKDYVAWADTKIPEIKQLPKQLREGVPYLIDTAKKCIKKHDYAQAAQLLQDVPHDFRTPEAQVVLDEALELQEESDLLLVSLQECVRTRDLHRIENNLKRFLQLKPGNKFAKELWESLQTYRKIPRKRRNYRFDRQGRLQPHGPGSLWDNWLLWGTLCFGIVLGVTYWGVMLYLKGESQTLLIEVDDTWLREQGGQLTLKIDDGQHAITAGDMKVEVKSGTHGFSVHQGDTIVHNSETFTIKEDDVRVLKIDATGMHLTSNKASQSENYESIAKSIPNGPPKETPQITVPSPPNETPKVARTTPLKSIKNDSFAGQKRGDRWSKNFLETNFLWIPGGQFRMGSVRVTPDEEDEQPVDVTISYGLWVQEHELTQGEWRKLVGVTPWMPFTDKQIDDRNAATHMTWDESVDFCQRLTDRDRQLGNLPVDWEYRLPSEAEWEYFCRAGTQDLYSFGNDVRELGKYAWWKENAQDQGEGYAHAVGQLLPNAWGLYDVHGNVYEMCYDSYMPQLPGGVDPVVSEPPIAGKICRGGGWAYYGPDTLECGERNAGARNVRRNRRGIRLVAAAVSEISTTGFRQDIKASAEPDGPIQTPTDWQVVPDTSTVDWRFSKEQITAIAGRKMSVAYLKSQFQDFELTLEIRCSDGANGGVYLRAPTQHATFQNVFEVHFGGGRDNVLPGTEFPSSGGLYLSDGHQSPFEPGGNRDWWHSLDVGAQAAAFRTGEWNRMKIRLIDQVLTVEVNEQQTMWRRLDDVAIAFPHFAEAVASRRGYIGLQCFLGTLEFRNIHIQPFKPD